MGHTLEPSVDPVLQPVSRLCNMTYVACKTDITSLNAIPIIIS